MPQIEIASEDLIFTPIPNPGTTHIKARMVVDLAGADVPESYSVIQWLSDGRLVKLELDESVVLDGNADLRFVLFRSSSKCVFEMDGQTYEWGDTRIKGRALKILADVDPEEFGVWQECTNDDDLRVENDEYAILKNELEKFFTACESSTEGN